jgi:uncharacterized protein
VDRASHPPATSAALLELPSQPVPPTLTRLSEAYWTGGVDGELRIQRCLECRRWGHPPSPICRSCRSTALRPEAASGSGSVFTYTVNHQRWSDGDRPYAVALVALAEQEDLLVHANLVGLTEASLSCGLPVKVAFAPFGQWYLPYFVGVVG